MGMKKSGKIFPLFSLILVTFSLSALATSNPALSMPDMSYDWGQWQFSTRANYLATTSNFTSNSGEYVDLPNSYSYKLFQWDFGFRWVVIPKAAISLSGQFAAAESQDYLDTRRNSNLTEINLGADYELLARKNWDLLAEVVLSNPVQRVKPTSDEVMIHEGSMNLGFNLGGRYFNKSSTLYAKTGFTYRDENRSSLLTYLAGSAFHFGTWSFAAEIEGFNSMISDQRNNTSQRNQVIARNGNSLKFYSTDPALLSLNGWIQKDLTADFSTRMGLSQSLNGSAYAAGTNIFIDLTWSPDSVAIRNQRTNRPGDLKKASDKSESVDFHEDTADGVDQKFFEPKPSLKKQNLDLLPDEATPPSSPTPSRNSPLKKTKTPADLKKELDQTEFQIELKTTKKKKKKK